jgi:hypothetical protein
MVDSIESDSDDILLSSDVPTSGRVLSHPLSTGLRNSILGVGMLGATAVLGCAGQQSSEMPSCPTAETARFVESDPMARRKLNTGFPYVVDNEGATHQEYRAEVRRHVNFFKYHAKSIFEGKQTGWEQTTPLQQRELLSQYPDMELILDGSTLVRINTAYGSYDVGRFSLHLAPLLLAKIDIFEKAMKLSIPSSGEIQKFKMIDGHYIIFGKGGKKIFDPSNVLYRNVLDKIGEDENGTPIISSDDYEQHVLPSLQQKTFLKPKPATVYTIEVSMPHPAVQIVKYVRKGEYSRGTEDHDIYYQSPDGLVQIIAYQYSPDVEFITSPPKDFDMDQVTIGSVNFMNPYSGKASVVGWDSSLMVERIDTTGARKFYVGYGDSSKVKFE